MPFLNLFIEESEEPHHLTIPRGAGLNSTDSGRENISLDHSTSFTPVTFVQSISDALMNVQMFYVNFAEYFRLGFGYLTDNEHI